MQRSFTPPPLQTSKKWHPGTGGLEGSNSKIFEKHWGTWGGGRLLGSGRQLTPPPNKPLARGPLGGLGKGAWEGGGGVGSWEGRWGGI